MILAILAVTTFQGYWLRENYQKEKTNLELKTSTTFKETILSLQAQKFRTTSGLPDSMHEFDLEIKDNREPRFNIRLEEGEALAGYMSNVATRVIDTVQHPGEIKEGVVIALKGSGKAMWRDSSREIRIARQDHNGNRIVRFLYSIDSLQDSLRVEKIDSAFRHAISKKKIDVPFTISRNNLRDSATVITDPMTVRVGLANPVGYQLKLGNSYPYLLRQMASPILFSLFLVGVTIFSFMMLYRSLIRQRKLAALKNEFISNITHELKTPIATVSVAMEAISNFNALSDPERTKEYLAISQNELQRLSLLVDKVLKLSMFEKKEIDLKWEPVELKGIVEEVISSMKLQIEKQGAVVSAAFEGNSVIEADRLHLLSVVFNLLDNALKYGNGKMGISFHVREKENFIEMVVADNGIGIAEEYQDKVFEKFFRVPAGDTHNIKGYGLGLSYVYHVIEKHKGTIRMESEEGKGTSFIITLPKSQHE